MPLASLLFFVCCARSPGAATSLPAPPILFAKARLLTSGFGAEPWWPLVADVDGDGFGDLIAVEPGSGAVDVALSVRGGKLCAPARAASDVGALSAATTRTGASGRAEIVLTRADGAVHVVAQGEDHAWTVRAQAPPAAAAAPASSASPATPDGTVERRLAADFDGDGVPDEIVGTALHLAADASHPIDVPLLHDLPAGAIVVAGDLSGDHRADLVVFRRDAAWREGRDVLAYLAYRDGDADPDGDGLDRATEERWKTDPLDADTDHDGLLDGWEVKGEGALDLPVLGSSPTHKDCFVYVQRYSETDGALCAREMARVVKTWAELPNPNPDGTTGIALHPVWLPPLKPGTPPRAWWDLGNENLPRTARGLAHYMEISNGSGGQSSELGDMGGCGAGAFWACFLHEFGHQVGLSHAGGPLPGTCPTYGSLMNYAYSYGFNDDGNQIHYSRGELAALVLNEAHLSERLRYPIGQLGFLGKGPFRFKVQADGEATLVDWNRNGIFDEGLVRADITDAYGASGGARFGVGKTTSAPVLVEHLGRLQLFGVNRDHRLFRREIQGIERSTAEVVIGSVAPTGDLAAASDGREVWLLVPTADGIRALHAPDAEGLDAAEPVLLPDSQGWSVSAAAFGGHVLALLWRDRDTPVRSTISSDGGSWSPARDLAALESTFPPGAAEDPVTHELVVGIGTVRQENGEKHSWQVVRLQASAGGSGFVVTGTRVVGGAGSGWCGNSRPVIVIESGPGMIAEGRLHFIARGFTSAPSWNGCFYEAMTIGDATQSDGWRLRRFCDEWSTTASPVAACLHDRDLALAYRWFGNVHGDENDDVHVMLHGFGIDEADMHDFDDVSEIANLGLERSIPWRDPAAR